MLHHKESEPDVGPLSRSMREAASIYAPLNVTIELSTSCNLRCVHCYNFDRKQISNKPKSDKPPLSVAEVKRVLSEIRKAGGLVVAFSGGEALLHPHLNEFIREARRLKLAVRIKTNGTLVNQEKLNELSEAGASDLEMSVYGASAATHDPFTRTPGSFEKTIAAARIAKEFGMTPTLNFILHRACVSEFDQMLELAESLSVPYSISTELTKRYDGTEDSLDHRLTKADLTKLYTGTNRDFFAGSINTSENIQCACAKTNAGIGSDGTVYPCIGAPIASGDVREQSFDEIWNHSKVFNWIRGLKIQDFKSCAPCDLRPHCQRSSGATFTNTGDYTGKEEWACEQALLLKELNSESAN